MHECNGERVIKLRSGVFPIFLRWPDSLHLSDCPVFPPTGDDFKGKDCSSRRATLLTAVHSCLHTFKRCSSAGCSNWQLHTSSR